MTNKIEYQDIAKMQLDTAIRLYDEENYICAITLAKAAEEFLGKHMGDDAASKILMKKIQEKYEGIEGHINRVANFLKHGSDLDICGQDIPIRQESIQYVCRAILNYFRFTNQITDLMAAFAKEHTPEKIDLIIEAEEKKA